MANGIFGPTPSQIQQAMSDERLARANLISQMPLGSGGAIAGQLFGQAAGNLLGAQDPRLREAQATQEVQQEIAELGLRPGTQRFTEEVTQRFRNRGLEELAIRANIAARQVEQQELQTEQLRQDVRPADPRALQQRAQTFVLAGGDPNLALSVAQDPELFRSQLNQLTKPRDVPSQIQAYQLAVGQGFQGTFLDYQKQLKRAGASSVKVNIGDKPLSITDLQRIRDPSGRPLPPGTTPNQAAQAVASGQAQVLAPEEQAARTKQQTEAASKQAARETAGPVLQAYINAIRNPEISLAGFGEREQLEAGAAEALARLRQPTGILTDQDITRARSSLPGIGSKVTRAFEGRVKGLEKEIGISLSEQRRRIRFDAQGNRL